MALSSDKELSNRLIITGYLTILIFPPMTSLVSCQTMREPMGLLAEVVSFAVPGIGMERSSFALPGGWKGRGCCDGGYVRIVL